MAAYTIYYSSHQRSARVCVCILFLHYFGRLPLDISLAIDMSEYEGFTNKGRFQLSHFSRTLSDNFRLSR
jgi:hypothetical protein